MYTSIPRRTTASRGIAVTTFAVVLFLACTVYPTIWHFTTNNPNPSVDRGFAFILSLMISCMATILGTIGYAAALWRSLRIAHRVRGRLHMLSAAIGIASPLACLILAWCARHMPIRHLSDTNTVYFLLGCSLVLPYLLGTALLRLAARKDWLYPPRTPGLCCQCRYNLTGNTSGICPECGTPTPASPSNRPSITTWPPRPRILRQ